ncbi:MAG: ribosome biogenesis GTPase Der [Acidobacteriota bacterium]|nr:ribosome biogenesis GTPase Der [Acidobacteriota bacterium]MDE3043805.1 ribosome biogenesis GTPase Der [Acidobacteriota bacterium]MDE3223229.1 ribosome biogenesis GTPase Der [Acidobacteriota bacterium]
MSNPQVVVVGRPNVGKSSLVNRLAGRRVAVVEEQRGVTRDRKAVEVEWRGVSFDVVDTGGWLQAGDELEDKVSGQAEAALRSADLVLLVVDGSTGVMDEDVHAARWALRSKRPIILIVNKIDDERHEAQSWEFLSLGAGDPVMISALHGRGAGDLLDRVVDELAIAPAASADVEGAPLDEDDSLRVALVGRPNVGKSTLFNCLIGEERSVVHDLPGTTRDAIDTVVDTPNGKIRFIDTAGMRRRAKTEAGLETYAVLRSLDALDRADIAVLVIDATIGATGQDQRLAERISAAGCPAVVVLNKWELVPTEERDHVLATVGERLAFLGDAPVLKTTALSGKGVHKLWPALTDMADDYAKRVPTGVLNRAIRDLQLKHPAPAGKIRYAVQGATEPPTFTLFISGRLDPTYLRYVERSLRERFDLGSTPIRVRVRVE